jgi:SSS family solute:Na+ symporter
MTLFQRLLAAGDEKTAVKAWRIAAWFEWPVMAFMGVALGLLARVAAEQGLFSALTTAVDPEQALPILLAQTLPAGLMGLVMAAYFSAILSTADSCLMAASANFHQDILGKRWPKLLQKAQWSQWLTLLTGLLAIWLATAQSDVLELMLAAYAFLVSGLLVPLLFGLYSQRGNQAAAVYAMLLGGGTTLFLQLGPISLPYALDANIGGLTLSLATYLLFSFKKSS